MGRVFLAYGTPIMAVSLFWYLGKTLLSAENDWLAVERNLQRDLVNWERLTKILVMEGADKRIVGKFCVAVVQAVLLFGSETWVLTPQLEKALKGFHQQ